MKTTKKIYTFIDLFAGLGGFHIALESLGCKCVFTSELKEDLRQLYKLNFPYVPVIEGDITKVDLTTIPHHDILCAGFPCQPFSQAGKRQGFSDEGRGNMFDYICAIIEEKGKLNDKPKYLLLENVSNLKGHDDGNTWRIIQERLDALGYYVSGEILSPHQFGIPQHRKRIYIVGLRKDLASNNNSQYFAFPNEKKEKCCDITTIINKTDKDIQPLTLKTHQHLKVWQIFLTDILHNLQLYFCKSMNHAYLCPILRAQHPDALLLCLVHRLVRVLYLGEIGLAEVDTAYCAVVHGAEVYSPSGEVGCACPLGRARDVCDRVSC